MFRNSKLKPKRHVKALVLLRFPFYFFGFFFFFFLVFLKIIIYIYKIRCSFRGLTRLQEETESAGQKKRGKKCAGQKSAGQKKRGTKKHGKIDWCIGVIKNKKYITHKNISFKIRDKYNFRTKNIRKHIFC